jgi:E3 ubiquitin-protein ligase HUWE1
VDGPFSVLTKHIRLLDFDIKRRYFRKELDKIKENTPRGDTAIHVNRETIFDDSFRELHRKKPEDWKGKLYIVFNNEEGQDAGGLLREWLASFCQSRIYIDIFRFLVISRQMFNPNYALFAQAANDRVTYRINPYSDVNPTDKL